MKPTENPKNTSFLGQMGHDHTRQRRWKSQSIVPNKKVSSKAQNAINAAAACCHQKPAPGA